MPLFSHAKVLVWRAGMWQVSVMNELVMPDNLQPFSTAHVLDQLNSVPKAMLRQCQCILVPIGLSRVYASEIDPALPKELLPFAAQTFANEKEPNLNSESAVSYWLSRDSRKLNFAVMPSTLLEDIRSFTRLPLYSEALIELESLDVALDSVRSFIPTPQDFLAHNEHRKAMRRLLFGCMFIGISAIAITEFFYQDVPDEEPEFTWPWVKPNYQQQTISEALTYIRALPPSVRLDRTRVTQEQVIVEVTGLRLDIESWEERWPNDLPSLTLLVSPPALKQEALK